MRDKENYNFPSLNTTIQFVEIACHERLSATLGDAKKFQDSLTFNAQLAALQKVMLGIHLNKKILPYKDSKLTRVMQNYCNVNSEVTVICHAISNPREFIACLGYLQLVSRFRSDKKEKDLVAEVQKVAGDLKGEQVASNLTPAEEKEVRHRMDIIKELDSRYEFMKKEFKQNVAKIGGIIGAKESLEHLIYKKAANFWHEFREKGATLQKITAKDQVLLEKDAIIIRTQKKIEDLKRDLNERLEAHTVNIYQIQDEINYYRDLSNILKNNKLENDKEMLGQKFDKMRQLVAHNRTLLADKSAATNRFPRDLLAYKELSKPQTVESIKQQAFGEQKARNDAMMAKLLEQNAELLAAKRLEVAASDCSTRTVSRRSTTTTTHSRPNAKRRRNARSRTRVTPRHAERELEKELTAMYQFLKKQSKIIYNIKVGAA